LKQRVEESIPTSVFDTENADQEMQASYGAPEAEYKPAFLYVERGPGQGQLLEVKQGSVVVGRASVSDLRIQHPSISRRHAQIKRVGEQFFVKDLGSQNGTFVNKQRIATEVEMKVGDSIALGNALVRLRGPMTRTEKAAQQAQVQQAQAPAPKPAAQKQALAPPPPPAQERDPIRPPQARDPIRPPKERDPIRPPKERISTAVVARPSAPTLPPVQNSNALKLAVFAGAIGFGLAGALAFALVRAMSPAAAPVDKAPVVAAAASASDRDRQIEEAIARKMQEQKAQAAPSTPAPVPTAAPTVDDGAAVVVKAMAEPRGPTVTPAPRAAAAPSPRVAAAARPGKPAVDDDEEETPKAGGAKRTQILAAYEKGNAEGSLEAAKKAGDRDLAAKLTQFLQVYDAANDAMVSNNGTSAITNFTKALKLDEELSSGWGKYGSEIRKQLSSLYVLVGMQFASQGESDKAKKAFEASLKYDGSNARAKAQLEKLGGGAKASPDDAFGDDAAPRKVVKPAKKAQSIDDAFGD
jgi:pSer/pThr/pTyr-binding forkhead associated (FHA) protein